MLERIILIILTFTAGAAGVTLKFSSDDLDVAVGKTSQVTLSSDVAVQNETLVWFTYQIGNEDPARDQGKDNYVKALSNITIKAETKLNQQIGITGHGAGHLIIGVNSSSTEFNEEQLKEVFVRVTLVNSAPLVIISTVIGWVYFAAWSVSFYPQVYVNFSRKSVVGLNFDFLLYNITGFLAYGFFNVGMFWVPEVKDQYHKEHPRGINPVQLSDVIFTLHAVFVTIITIIQCFIYERGNQRVSKFTLVLVIGSWLFAAISLVVTLLHKITWLQYLYYFSYIKLGVTLIKYMPQAWMNFKRKSTEGWSIGNVMLDFTGGSLSLVQMFLLSYNSDDWGSIFGDPTKFGLGFFSVLFDILFMVQHYCLYRHNESYDSLIDHEYEEKEYLINSDADRPSYSSLNINDGI